MSRHAKTHAAAIGLALALGAGQAVAAESGVTSYCAAHPDSDFPARDFYGSVYNPSKIPKPVRKAGANAWRCMNGRVLVCRIGADGRPCQKLDSDPTPAPPIKTYCSANPSADFVPMVVIGQSSSTWRCQAGTPRALKTEALDKRGFIQSAWRPLGR
jgi:hypothetical protein